MVLPTCPKAPNKPRPRPIAGVSGGEQISLSISFPIVILRPPHCPKPVISKIVEPVSSRVRPRRRFEAPIIARLNPHYFETHLPPAH
jgi:hypothetical protein